MAYREDSSASGQDEPWINWFCSLKGHEMFCKVERSYIEDGFNLYGLRQYVQNFSDCLDLILDRIGPDDSDDSHLTQSACTLYGMIHARYIITAHGLDAMYNKYANKDFGTCPLIQCYGQPVLPVGLHDEIGQDHCKSFCPKCQNVYHPTPYMRIRSGHAREQYSIGKTYGGHSASTGYSRELQVDGACFGTTFAHLFLMTFHNLVPDRPSKESKYVPRVFGFRVHKSAKSSPNNANSNIPLLKDGKEKSSSSAKNNNSKDGNNGTNANEKAGATTNSNSANSPTVAASASAPTAAVALPAAAATSIVKVHANSSNGAMKPAAASSASGAGESSSKGKKGKGRRSKPEDGVGKRRAKINSGNGIGNGEEEGNLKKRPKRPVS